MCIHLQTYICVNICTQIYKHIHTHTPKRTEVSLLVNIHSVAKTNFKKKQAKNSTKTKHIHTQGMGEGGRAGEVAAAFERNEDI